jgi:hypothetical protein
MKSVTMCCQHLAGYAFVAQIWNLLYRRIAFCRASTTPRCQSGPGSAETILSQSSSIFLMLPFLWATGCLLGEKEVQLDYVLPNGFTGVVKLQSERPDGVAVIRTNDTYTLVFPDSGILKIKGKLPTLNWHSLNARYANGTAIPVAGPESLVRGDEIALRRLGVTADGKESWDIIGTEQEAREAIEEKWGFQRPR